MKYLIVSTTSKSVVSFRASLIKKLIAKGETVLVCANDSEREGEITGWGAKFVSLDYSNRSLSLLRTIKYRNKLSMIISQYMPSYILTFQAKPNTIGVLAAKKYIKNNKCTIVSVVEGVGDPFINSSLKWIFIKTILIYLYRRAFKFVNKAFFLNEDDSQLFLKLKIAKINQINHMNGIGIELNKYICSPLPNSFSVGYACRLLKTKGVFDYCEIARKCRRVDQSIRFYLAGAEANIKVEELRDYIDSKDIIYVGEINDMVDFYRNISVFCMTSYREGFPVTIMEAASSARSCIAYNVPGCRNAVINDRTGYIIERRDINSFVEKIIYLKRHSDILTNLSINARRYAEENFDSHSIQSKFLENICQSKKR